MPRRVSNYSHPLMRISARQSQRQAVDPDLHARPAVGRPALALVLLRATRYVRESEEFISQQKKRTRDKKHVQKCTREHPRAKHFKDDGTWVCPVCPYHDIFLKEEMQKAWAIVENASIS
eukprot:30676-Pelagococcus_subviridis.AAC.4